EGVAVQIALMEAVLEEAGEQVLILGERDHAVADVAGRKDVEVFAQASGGAAVVRDGDDGCEVADEAGMRCQEGIDTAAGAAIFGGDAAGESAGGLVDGAAGAGGRGDVALESAEKCG